MDGIFHTVGALLVGGMQGGQGSQVVRRDGLNYIAAKPRIAWDPTYDGPLEVGLFSGVRPQYGQYQGSGYCVRPSRGGQNDGFAQYTSYDDPPAQHAEERALVPALPAQEQGQQMQQIQMQPPATFNATYWEWYDRLDARMEWTHRQNAHNKWRKQMIKETYRVAEAQQEAINDRRASFSAEMHAKAHGRRVENAGAQLGQAEREWLARLQDVRPKPSRGPAKEEKSSKDTGLDKKAESKGGGNDVAPAQPPPPAPAQPQPSSPSTPAQDSPRATAPATTSAPNNDALLQVLAVVQALKVTVEKNNEETSARNKKLADEQEGMRGDHRKLEEMLPRMIEEAISRWQDRQLGLLTPPGRSSPVSPIPAALVPGNVARVATTPPRRTSPPSIRTSPLPTRTSPPPQRPSSPPRNDAGSNVAQVGARSTPPQRTSPLPIRTSPLPTRTSPPPPIRTSPPPSQAGAVTDAIILPPPALPPRASPVGTF